MGSGLLEMLPINYLFANHEVCVCVCVCEQDLELNNLQGLICCKTQPTRDPFRIGTPLQGHF